jgi:hypothetical protein
MLSIWMQTTGAVLLAVKRCSLTRVLMPAQDSRSTHRLLYLLLYGTTRASKNAVKATLTSALLQLTSRVAER